jgi:hypothetical protein
MGAFWRFPQNLEEMIVLDRNVGKYVRNRQGLINGRVISSTFFNGRMITFLSIRVDIILNSFENQYYLPLKLQIPSTHPRLAELCSRCFERSPTGLLQCLGSFTRVVKPIWRPLFSTQFPSFIHIEPVRD